MIYSHLTKAEYVTVEIDTVKETARVLTVEESNK